MKEVLIQRLDVYMVAAKRLNCEKRQSYEKMFIQFMGASGINNIPQTYSGNKIDLRTQSHQIR